MISKKVKILLCIGVVLVVLGIYLALNPTWITKPKYMLDSQYCEVDSDCVKAVACVKPTNIYNKLPDSCKRVSDKVKCMKNQCIVVNREAQIK